MQVLQTSLKQKEKNISLINAYHSKIYTCHLLINMHLSRLYTLLINKYLLMISTCHFCHILINANLSIMLGLCTFLLINVHHSVIYIWFSLINMYISKISYTDKWMSQWYIPTSYYMHASDIYLPLCYEVQELQGKDSTGT